MRETVLLVVMERIGSGCWWCWAGCRRLDSSGGGIVCGGDAGGWWMCRRGMLVVVECVDEEYYL